jgi:hypothetical protein
MTTRRNCLAIALAFSVSAPALAFAAEPTSKKGAPDKDRASILAMAGDYRVHFDMRETVPFVADYKPLGEKHSGGYEAVRVVEDRGDFISLQHLLVVEDDGKPMIVKHWRQDWTWEPAKVLAYETANKWVLKDVPAEARKGAWSQTVWQTDDSPRYGGVGKWAYEGGVASWQSDKTLRPLARRDAVRKPVYAWYAGTNRHAITPDGWVHEQDNAKLGVKDSKPVTYVHEVVLNTYTKSSDFKVKAADDYWNATKSYWAEVRTAWDRAIAKDRGVTVTEEAQNGSIVGPKLMGLADEIAEGKTTTAAAVTEATTLIAGPTKARPLASLK